MTKKYVIQISTFKDALNHVLALEKVHKVIVFNQEAWLKPHIDMNIEKKQKMTSLKIFLS